MVTRVDTYSTRGFVRTLAFSLAVMAVSATFLYLTAPERLICERAADGEVVCGLTRTMMGLTVRVLRLGSVRGAAVKTSEPVPARVGERPRQREASHWVRYDTAGGLVEGVQSHSYSEHADLVKELTAFIADGRARTFEARVAGHGPVFTYVPWVFGFGASLVPLWVVGYLFPWTRPKARR